MDHHDPQAPGTITIFPADDNLIVREGCALSSTGRPT